MTASHVESWVSLRGSPNSCRRSKLTSHLLGGGAFLGLAAYMYISGQSQLEARRAEILKMNTRFGLRSRSLGITGLSVALAWVGLWRLVK